MVQQGVDAKPHWDRDVMLAGLPDGGVLDLSTGKPRPAERGDFVSRRLGVMPNRHVSPTRFLRFLGEMTGDIPGVVQWLRSYLGYLLTGHTVNHVALFLLGDGAAGKSTLVELLTHILGDYAARVPPDALVAKRGSSDRHPEWMTALDGTRFAATAEMPTTGARLRAGLFKTLTGGDTIRANRMRRDGYSFRPSAKLLLYGNTRPAIPGEDTGLKRRLVVVRCFPAKEPDEGLADVLKGEAEGVLAWMAKAAAEGWTRHVKGGKWLPVIPEAIRTDSAAYFCDHDPLGRALEDVAEFGAHGLFTSSTRIREALRNYYNREELGTVPTDRKIAESLRSRNCNSTKDRGARGWSGIRIRDEQ